MIQILSFEKVNFVVVGVCICLRDIILKINGVVDWKVQKVMIFIRSWKVSK